MCTVKVKTNLFNMNNQYSFKNYFMQRNNYKDRRSLSFR